MEALTFLRSLQLFESFSEETVKDIADRAIIRDFRSDESILDQESKGQFFGILMEGSVMVCHTRLDGSMQLVATLKEKEYFGEISLISGQSSDADLIAKTDGRLILIPKEVFSKHLENNAEAVKHFAKTIAKRLRYREDSIFPGEGSVHPDDPYGLALVGLEPPSKILVINSGSSSLKFNFYDTSTPSKNLKGTIESIGTENACIFLSAHSEEKTWKENIESHEKALEKVFNILTSSAFSVISEISEIAAVGHRVVHGGEKYSNPQVINNDVISEIEKISNLAPLHNPINLMGIINCKKLMPGIPQVAVFDTAFHNKMPEYSYLYGLPYELYRDNGVRRYGFHGSSHHYVSLLASTYLKTPFKSLKIISCHLGNGASICAIDRGRSVDTSMGFTPLEGIIMGTRCGDIDPAIIPFLSREKGLDMKEIEDLLQNQSGLKGISGVSNDMQLVLEAAGRGNERAYTALNIFCYKVKKYIGSYIAALGGADVIIFTGGIGEKASGVRALICQGLSCLGITIDEDQNRRQLNEHGILELSFNDYRSQVRVLAVATDEERMIARETVRALGFARVSSVMRKSSKPIPIGISAHHVHVSERDLAILFGDGHKLTKKFELSQPGQFAAEETVNLLGPKGRVDGVRILGPTREETQVEIARTEEFKLGIKAPVRESGDLFGSPGLVIEGPKGVLNIKHGLICAKRHIHMTPKDATEFGLKDKDMVMIKVHAERPIVFGGTLVRVSPSFTLELHLDTDEGNAAGIASGDFAYFDSLEERKSM